MGAIAEGRAVFTLLPPHALHAPQKCTLCAVQVARGSAGNGQSEPWGWLHKLLGCPPIRLKVDPMGFPGSRGALRAAPEDPRPP